MPDPTSLLSNNPMASAPAAAAGLAKTVVSLVNAGKAKNEAKLLGRTRPKRSTSKYIDENLSLAESELAGGLSTAAEKAYTNEMDRQQAGAYSAILRGGGDVNTVADVYGAGEEGRQRLAMITEQMRMNQIKSVMDARTMAAEEADKNFIFNDWMPWADASSANAQARKDAEAGIWSGLDTMTGAATNFINSGGAGGGGGSLSSGALASVSSLPASSRPASTIPDSGSFNQDLPQPIPGRNPLYIPYPARRPNPYPTFNVQNGSI